MLADFVAGVTSVGTGSLDVYMARTLFRQEDGSSLRNGVFVDVGAYDGYHGSASLTLEKALGWTGVCIEAQAHLYERLIKHRSCIALNAAAHNYTGVVRFTQPSTTDPGDFIQMMGGITDAYDPRHTELIRSSSPGIQITEVEVQAVRLQDVLAEHGIKHVDYMKLDTENSEAWVLAGMDFNAVSVDVLQVEEIWPSNSGPVYARLFANGYVLVEKVEKDLIFLHKSRLVHV